MAKIGVELRIDVSKIDKARLYKGAKGTYLTMTSFIDLDEKDQYDNNGMITHKKEDGEDRAPILGNAKIFWSDSSQPQQPGSTMDQAFGGQRQQPQQQPMPQGGGIDDFDDDIDEQDSVGDDD